MRFRRAHYTLGAAIALSALASGCGAKGPLFLPEPSRTEPAPAATPQKAPADLPDAPPRQTEQ